MSVTGSQMDIGDGPYLGIKNANVFRNGRKSLATDIAVEDMVNSYMNK